LGLSLRLVKEVFAVQGLVVIGNGLGAIALRVLEGLDTDLSIKRRGREEVGVVGVPAGLEGPVRDNGELSVCLAGLGVPTDITVIFAGRQEEIRIMLTPRK
jgi:hypothetical protein